MKKIALLGLVAVLLVACAKKEETFQTEQIVYNETVYANGSQEDSLHVYFDIEYPTQLTHPAVLLAVQEDMKFNIFGGVEYAKMDISEAIQHFTDVLTEEYLIMSKTLAAEATMNEEENMSSPMVSEEWIVRGKVEGVQDDILSYSMEQYVYTGGAHGVTNRFYYNYDLETGLLLTEEDLFIGDYAVVLAPLLLANLTVEEEVLGDYDTEKILPNGNFYLSDEGITFVYNPYEIAPYAYGETEILIPWEAVQDIRK